MRDGQQDTRLAAERGVKTAYAVKGHSCEEDAEDDAPGAGPVKGEGEKPGTGFSGQNGTQKPQ